MALIKLNNRSVKDATAFGSISSLGSLTFISKQTASSSANISFTSGIDSTYKEYLFTFKNIHPQNDSVKLQVNFRDGGSSYDATKTTTAFQKLAEGGSDNDQSISGEMFLFNPSSTTFVKHFSSRFNMYQRSDYTQDHYIAGYFNTTSAVDAIQFKMDSGNIDSGTIKLYGIKDS